MIDLRNFKCNKINLIERDLLKINSERKRVKEEKRLHVEHFYFSEFLLKGFLSSCFYL